MVFYFVLQSECRQNRNQPESIMKILRAEHLGMCFGVRDAIALATATARHEPLTILGDLVHNETVLAEMRRQGVRFEQQPDRVTTSTVMITAHGASERAIEATRRHGLKVLEATCPLVHHAHHSLKKLVAQGCHPVIIGQRGHVEVRGLTEDLAECDIVLSEADIAGLRERPRFGVMSQTTQPIATVRHLTQCLRARFPAAEVRLVDTVCQPTKQRQLAAVELARQCTVVIVLGGAHSNNTRELARTCAQHCPRVHHVPTAEALRPEWFQADDTVGLTAGTSTPDSIIHEVERQLHEFARQQTAIEQSERTTCELHQMD